MKKTIYEIDVDGFMTYRTMEFDGEELPENFVDTPLPSDDDGNQMPFWRPKWTGKEWVEARPQAEIDEEMNAPTPLSETEVISQDVEAVAEMVSIVAEESFVVAESVAVVTDDSNALAEALTLLLTEMDAMKTKITTLEGV